MPTMIKVNFSMGVGEQLLHYRAGVDFAAPGEDHGSRV
jgi:hypothetical protein